MKNNKIKVYVYNTKNECFMNCDIEVLVYAKTKKQANELIDLYRKESKKECVFLGITQKKKAIEKMNILVESFGSEDNLIKAQYEVFENMKSVSINK